MGLFSKFSYTGKAKAIAKKYGLTYELLEMGVEAINKMAMESRNDTEKFVDLLLYNYYKNTCAYTASNVMAFYIDVYRGLKAEVPGYEFFNSVGKYLEQASAIPEIFESKEYYLNLASYEIISDKRDFQKAFDIMMSVKPEYMTSDTQYITGCLYYALGMFDMAKKVLETSISDMDSEQRASAGCLLGIIYDTEDKVDECIEWAKLGLKSSLPAVFTASCRLLNTNGCYDIVADVMSDEIFESNKNIRLFYEWVYSLAKLGKSTDVLMDLVSEDELYSRVKEVATQGERVDVDALVRDVNQEIMDGIANSELYEYADDTTKRMLNNRILGLSSEDEDYEKKDYVVLKAFYLD